MMQVRHEVSRTLIFFLGSYLVVLNISAFIALFWIWPSGGNKGAVTPEEVQYLIIALIGGMLGTSIAVLTSFSIYVGSNQMFTKGLTWWYFFRPLIGATLGLITYAAIRGGILKVEAQIDVLNPYAITALSAAAGLYSKQLIEWLNNKGDKLLFGSEISPNFLATKISQDEKKTPRGEESI